MLVICFEYKIQLFKFQHSENNFKKDIAIKEIKGLSQKWSEDVSKVQALINSAGELTIFVGSATGSIKEL